MNRLTLDRIFGSPDLNGAPPVSPKLSPDGDSIAFLKSSDDDSEVLNLWRYHPDGDRSELLVDATELHLYSRQLSDEEKANRERRRIRYTGIVEFQWSPTSDAIAFLLDGNLYLYRFGADLPLEQLTDDNTFETDLQFSTDGRYLSFVREKDIYLIDLDTSTPAQLTDDGGDLVSNGIAEYIAQEEMHRFSGYWWSPDSRSIACLQVDESPVQLSQRFEIDAESFSIFDQRYPFAGTPNASVRLRIIDVESRRCRWIDLERDPESYIARVNWLANSEELAVQIQSRDQKTLELVFHHVHTGNTTRVLTETSETWLNLHDVFHSLADDSFIWASERDGYLHLYHLDRNGNVINQLTRGNWVVADLLGVDEADGAVCFSGFMDSPRERHLYRVNLQGPETPERLTRPGAWHQVEVGRSFRYFVDQTSSAEDPVGVAIRHMDGALIRELAPVALTGDHPFSPFRESLGKVSFGELQSEDGQALHYRLIEPATREPGQRYPVIITVYGGPGVQRVTNQWIPPWNHYMASRGYGLFTLDNRGSTNRGKQFESPIHGLLGKVEVDDQLTGVEFLKQLDWVDPARLGVFGHSYGGYMTLMLLMKAPGTFRAGVSVAPVTDWRLYDTHYTERFLGHPDENVQGYEQSAVFPWVGGLADPLLVIHGMADDNVLFTHSTKLFKALQDANLEFEMMTYPGAKHGLTGREVELHRFTTMDRFLDKHLKG
ncbi:MAG: DPP IV N-terminal domain-containing protein [Pseudomonadales bacterium]|nr:DPP IV N-terminal domain-containing protein [Pseudomonadales bacterium]